MSRTIQQPRRSNQKLHPRRRSAWRWAGVAIAPLAVVVLVVVSAVSETADTPIEEATSFRLSATNGQTVSLEESLADGDALLYFSMGVGCDGCFAQIPELGAAVAERGITLLPIMVDPAPLVAAEAARFGIEGPILIDSDASVSMAYGMVGIYGHGDRPSHSFALVRQDGTIGWVRHYAEMFVPADQLLGELDAALGT